MALLFLGRERPSFPLFFSFFFPFLSFSDVLIFPLKGWRKYLQKKRLVRRNFEMGLLLKFIYSEKATNVCPMLSQIYGGDFAKFCSQNI